MIKRENAGKLSLILAVVFLFSYLLNFVWESWHGVFLYEEHNVAAAKYVLMMNHVSVMDAVIITGMYFVTALVSKDIFWPKEWYGARIAVFLVIGVFVAVVIEYMAVYVLRAWSYNAFMPLVLGIGLSPLLQLSVTGVLAIYVARRTFYP